MLIDMVKMPPVYGIPIDRRFAVTTQFRGSPDVDINAGYWPHIPQTYSSFTVGALITEVPQQLYKMIHISYDDQYIFETVFSKEYSGYVCLYTKIISKDGVYVALSLNAIDEYKKSDGTTVPASWLIAIPQYDQKELHDIVPPVFGGSGLWAYTHQLIKARFGESKDKIRGELYKPIYDYIPHVFEALINGHFYRSPFHEMTMSHPLIRIEYDDWSGVQKLNMLVEARGFSSELNHPDFDAIALAALDLNPVRFSVSCLISHALDGLVELWLTKQHHDPYHVLLLGPLSNREKYNTKLVNLLYQCAKTYCRLYRIDPNVFLTGTLARSTDHSSITITKNIYDEVTVSFHDIINDRYVCFYTSFPAIALATLSVGVETQ